MSYIKDQPWFTSLMDRGDMTGTCANCGKPVKEGQFTIDDCYGVYRGRCPHCNSVNLLEPKQGAMRGYSGKTLYLCLPTDHEVKMNNWETDIPTTPCTCKECKAP